jgi:hypothetical protein
VVITPTQFVCQLLEQLYACFAASGFVPPSASAEQRAVRHLPLAAAIDKLAAASSFFQACCNKRSAMLGNHKGLAGPDGSLYRVSMNALATTVANVCTLQSELVAANVSHAERITLHSQIDEGKVESSFGEWVKASSIDNPDAKEYRQRKSALMRHALSRLSQPPYDHHESRNTYYQPSHCSIVQVVRIWRLVRRFHAKRHPPSPLRKPSLARLAIESGNARRIVAIGRHQRKATVRGKFYKGNGMYGPDVLIETDASEAVVDAHPVIVSSGVGSLAYTPCEGSRPGCTSARRAADA